MKELFETTVYRKARPLVLSLALLVSCGDSAGIEYSGKVVAKDHKEATTSILMLPCGNSLCPSPVVIPESWDITIQVCEPDVPTASKCEDYDFDPTEEQYDSVQVGDTVEVHEDTIVRVLS